VLLTFFLQEELQDLDSMTDVLNAEGSVEYDIVREER
jgi:hypothetical protein